MRFGSVCSDAQKICSKCGAFKPISDGFHFSAKASDKRASWCKSCTNEIKRGSRQRVYSSELKAKWALKTRYGLRPEDKSQMLADQSGLCAICSEPMAKPVVDHDHKTGKVRAILCHACNIKLAPIEDAEYRSRAIEYLERFK